MNECKFSCQSLEETTEPSLLSCCHYCQKDNRCLSVLYRHTDHTCKTNDICPSVCSNVGTSEPGWSLLCNGHSVNCLKIKNSCGEASDGVYTIDPSGHKEIQVYCDLTAAEGGWTVFQRRYDGHLDFYREWEEYKRGFGDPAGEYWLGNDNLHELTKHGVCKLRVEIVSFQDEVMYAEYSNFSIRPEQEGYAIDFNQYFGTAGDGLRYHKGFMFSTKDIDNDNKHDGNCAIHWHAAWWYDRCLQSNLNGKYGNAHGLENMVWSHLGNGTWIYAKASKMMIKC